MITLIECISRGVIRYILDSSRSSQFSNRGPLRKEGKGSKGGKFSLLMSVVLPLLGVFCTFRQLLVWASLYPLQLK